MLLYHELTTLPVQFHRIKCWFLEGTFRALKDSMMCTFWRSLIFDGRSLQIKSREVSPRMRNQRLGRRIHVRTTLQPTTKGKCIFSVDTGEAGTREPPSTTYTRWIVKISNGISLRILRVLRLHQGADIQRHCLRMMIRLCFSGGGAARRNTLICSFTTLIRIPGSIRKWIMIFPVGTILGWLPGRFPLGSTLSSGARWGTLKKAETEQSAKCPMMCSISISSPTNGFKFSLKPTSSPSPGSQPQCSFMKTNSSSLAGGQTNGKRIYGLCQFHWSQGHPMRSMVSSLLWAHWPETPRYKSQGMASKTIQPLLYAFRRPGLKQLLKSRRPSFQKRKSPANRPPSKLLVREWPKWPFQWTERITRLPARNLRTSTTRRHRRQSPLGLDC